MTKRKKIGPERGVAVSTSTILWGVLLFWGVEGWELSGKVSNLKHFCLLLGGGMASHFFLVAHLASRSMR